MKLLSLLKIKSSMIMNYKKRCLSLLLLLIVAFAYTQPKEADKIRILYK